MIAAPGPAVAQETPVTHIIHPFGYFRAEWDSTVTGQDTGDAIFRAIGGATYRYDHPGGTSFTVQYQGQYINLPQLNNLNSVVHIGTAMISHHVPITRANLLADSFTPYIGAQVLHRMPTNTPGAPSHTDGDYFLGFNFQKHWTREHLLYYGLHFDYYGAEVNTSSFWAASGIVGYRWLPTNMVLFTAQNRVQWRNPIVRQLGNTIRAELAVDVDVFPFPWLQVGPDFSVQYDTGSNIWSWTAGISFGGNLWFLR